MYVLLEMQNKQFTSVLYTH